MFGKLKEKLKSFIGRAKEPEKQEEKPEKQKKKEEKHTAESKPAKAPKKKAAKEPVAKEPKKITKEETKTKSPSTPGPEPVVQQPPKEQTSSEPQGITPEDETPPQEQRPISEPKKPSFLQKFTKKIISSTQTLTQEQVNEILEPLELILLENNVALEVVDKIKEDLSKDLVGIEVKKGQIESTITQTLKESIESTLLEPPDLIKSIHSKLTPCIIVFFGINGSGKTTSIAKLAHLLKAQNISCVLAAADTFRAASIEQLETHAKKLDIPIIKSQYGADPTSVAFDAVQYANKNKLKCVLIDTAGRMYTKSNLIKEMEKLIRVIKPDLKIFVGESITGNDATQQAKTFNEAVGIDGIILSKADVDEKGGTMLSVSQITGKPIYYLGTGQGYEDLEPFKKEKIIKRLGL